MSKKLQAYALMRKQWVTPLDSLRAVGLMALSQRAGEIERDEALMKGHKMLRKWVKTADSRVRAYRIVPV